MIISDGPDVVEVETFIPTSDPSKNNEYFQWASDWFNGLRVLVK
jgi:hypothetical protein